MIEVVSPGLLTTVQDLGRPGLAHLGVPPSGAADTAAHVLANRLVGNPPDAATLEATVVGPTLRFLEDALVAVAGRRVPVRAGEMLDIGPVLTGVRAYVAVAGGIEVEPVLGSRSHDQLTGLGPPPLEAGQLLAVGPTVGVPADESPGRRSRGSRLCGSFSGRGTTGSPRRPLRSSSTRSTR
jgi:allophanate hydrolase subunit 2